MSTNKRGTRYDEEFKRTLVNLYQNGNKSQAALCEEYGVSITALGRWIKQYSTVETDDGEVLTAKQVKELQKRMAQRIYKATGNNYVDWLEEIKPRPEERYFPTETNIYIYGHSLDATDKDILATLITAENTKTTIFYHNREALEKQIINLVKVITEDELIRRTGMKKIIFKPITET